MNRFISRAVFGGLLATALPTSAQWHEYPETGIPRLADGKFDADAALQKQRDLSGLWKVASIGLDLEGSLNGDALTLPWARELVKQRIAREGVDDPSSFCMPGGIIVQHLYSPFRVFSMPDRIVMLFEVNTTFRQIFLDGRPFPKDPLPSYMGYSVGRWEGDTLIVESRGFNGRFWITDAGWPVTEQLRLTERFKRTSFGRLEVEITFDDPGAYRKPWTVKVPFNYVPDSELMEAYCENNKFVEQLEDAGLKPLEEFVAPAKTDPGKTKK